MCVEWNIVQWLSPLLAKTATEEPFVCFRIDLPSSTQSPEYNSYAGPYYHLEVPLQTFDTRLLLLTAVYQWRPRRRCTSQNMDTGLPPEAMEKYEIQTIQERLAIVSFGRIHRQRYENEGTTSSLHQDADESNLLPVRVSPATTVESLEPKP